ncbi:MAG: hypothetical protein ACM3VS_03435 [Candidatus Dadabacteria bacterium]
MKNYSRDLLVLYRDAYNEHLLEHELETLHRILYSVECNEVFCRVHQLVMRNRITEKSKSILKAVNDLELKPFYFLLNKN